MNFAIIVFPGSNCDHDCYNIVKHVFGRSASFVWHKEKDLSQFDAVILPGGNWPTMSIVERLERDLGKPVLTNNAASIWAGLRILGRHDSIAGYGRLLSNTGEDDE